MKSNHGKQKYPIGLLLHAANAYKDTLLNDYFAGKDITAPQFKVLMGIYKGFNSPADLSKHMVMDSGALSRSLERLVKRGLIKRIPVPDDKRQISVLLTESGADLCNEFESNGMINLPAKILENLTEAEAKKLEELLIKMLPRHFFDRYFPY